MEELEQILRQQAKRYPLMEPTDAVKLIYQNEFGGGHLIQDVQKCLEYLHREYESVEQDETVPLYEYIGNGICRVHLAALEREKLDALGQAFIRSAAAHKGTIEGFLQKLSVLSKLAKEGVFAFSAEALEDYLQTYEKQGYPAVSHSEGYRAAYHPAYRIVKK